LRNDGVKKQQSKTSSKPRIRDARRTRARILNTAVKLFSAKGLLGASVDEIAARARINKRMIYHYFGNKQGLYLAVLDNVYRNIRNIRSISVDINSQSTDVRDLLRGMIREYFTFLQQNPEFVSLLNWENSRGAAGLKQIDLTGLTEPFMHALQQALSREQAGNAIRDDVDIKFLFISCLALCGYYFSNRHTLSVVFGINLEDPASMEHWLEHICDLVIKGVTNKT
jgi:TetR/AcrR family transcriptional regulator